MNVLDCSHEVSQSVMVGQWPYSLKHNALTYTSCMCRGPISHNNYATVCIFMEVAEIAFPFNIAGMLTIGLVLT